MDNVAADAEVEQPSPEILTAADTGLIALTAIAASYRIASQPETLAREYALKGNAEREDILRAAGSIGLKSRLIVLKDERRLATLPMPAIACFTDGGFALLAGTAEGGFRLVNPAGFTSRIVNASELLQLTGGNFILIQRRFGGPGASREGFGFRWFLPSIWRYRKAFGHVLLASLFVQLFALVTPLFFQVVVDKVLTHRSYSTLIVLVIGLAAIGLFDVVLQYLRTYALSHTTNRIDVELGRRLFRHLLNLPLSYFETRAAGQTVARVRELETIRNFLTGQGLFSGLDLIFTVIFIFVLFCYSTKLAWIVVASIPFYLAIGFFIRPFLKERIDEKFDRGAFSQQLLVETVVGVQTLKASAVEPVVAAEWEERLAAYVRSSFAATMLAAKGQNAIQYVSKITSAALAAQKALVATLTERVSMRSELIASEAGSRAQVIDAMQSQQEAAATLATQTGQLAQAHAAFNVATSEAAKLVDSFLADNVEKLSEAARRVDELEQQVIKAEKRRSAMIITSPVDGIVQASAITTIGQVISAGSELMRIVPQNAALEIEAYLPNRDIGFVAAGQTAVIKVEAYPFTRYGMIDGHVTRVATDAIPEPDAQQVEAAAAKELESTIPTGNVQRVQNLVFPVTISPDRTSVDVDGKAMPLSPGMAVTVEVKTGKRRILEYLFSPLAQISSEAMGER
jgi:HlyD family type I secretion membrane fusion protein